VSGSERSKFTPQQEQAYPPWNAAAPVSGSAFRGGS